MSDKEEEIAAEWIKSNPHVAFRLVLEVHQGWLNCHCEVETACQHHRELINAKMLAEELIDTKKTQVKEKRLNENRES